MEPLLLSPEVAAQLLDVSQAPHSLGLAPGMASGIQECFCIFAAEGHWALLWGRRHGHDLHWTYLDPLSDGLRTSALILATRLTGLLGCLLYTSPSPRDA